MTVLRVGLAPAQNLLAWLPIQSSLKARSGTKRALSAVYFKEVIVGSTVRLDMSCQA